MAQTLNPTPYQVDVPASLLAQDASAWAFARAANLHGLPWTPRTATHVSGLNTPLVRPPNISKVLQALGYGEQLRDLAHLPNRDQIRFGKSAYLLAELPLGQFSEDRYGAALYNLSADSLQEFGLPEPIDVPEHTHDHTRGTTDPQEDLHLVLNDPAHASEVPDKSTHMLYTSRVPRIEAQASANVMWLTEGGFGYQITTGAHTEFVFCLQEHHLQPHLWHPMLHEAIQALQPLGQCPQSAPPREHWQAGNYAWMGQMAFKPAPIWIDSQLMGLEDAWVLSRMLENYEEDWADGFSEYEKYRRARARRVHRALQQRWQLYTNTNAWANVKRNLNIAFSTRFLPEIAMQKADWLYGHDCIRGFR